MDRELEKSAEGNTTADLMNGEAKAEPRWTF